MVQSEVPSWDKAMLDAGDAAVKEILDPLFLPRRLEWYIAMWTADAMNRYTSFSSTASEVLESHEQGVERTLSRLLAGPFSRGRVFHTDRWNQNNRELERAFQRRRRELGDVSFKEAWRAIAGSVLTAALLSEEMPESGKRIEWVLRYLQHEIEKDLLHGRTTDAKGEALIEESEEAKRRLKEVEIEAAMRETARRLYQEFATTLTPENQAILLAERGTLTELAQKLGKGYDAVKKQHSRLWHRFTAWAKERVVL